MKIISISNCYYLANGKSIDRKVANAISTAKLNPKLNIKLIYLLNGANEFKKDIISEAPDNFKIIRYPSNREFNLAYVLINYLLKQDISNVLILDDEIRIKINKLKMINKQPIQKIMFNKHNFGYIISRSLFLKEFIKDVNIVNKLKCLIN